ncbi:uncharacterized protein LOC129593744 isoform X2 [Paramacrobiotus metropolitanus]|nr:uncharacterized protein LOC129593744 isoform X2 [Paramacrobiotus metropolitanus]
MSRVRPYYGVKYNPDPIVLRVMAQLDVGFYCGSPREIQSAFNMGVAPSRIVYSNPCKHRSFIKWAQENDIGLLIFDNEEELHKIKQGHPNAACILRIVAGGQNRANLSANEKYGANAVSARLLISISKNLGLNLKGICVHLEGTESSTRNVFGNVVQEVRQLFDYAQETFQISMDLITIEGNFLDQDDSLASVESLVEAYFPADAQPQVKIIAECAGCYVRSAITLCSTVIAKRKVTNHGLNISIMYYINAGRLGSLKIHRPQAQIARFANNKEDASDHIKSSIWGPTCAALDVVTTECYLPEMQIGERLVFPGMGIDSLTCASTFNGMPLTQSVYVVPNATFHCQQMAKCPPTSQDIERLVDRASENYFIHPMDPGMTERSLIVQTEIDISGATKTISCTQNYTDVPFFVVNLDDVSRKYFHWIQTFPRIMPFYAVKCNPDLVLLRLLADLGTGFDCASPHEIQTVLNMGVHPERIIYANPCKQQSYIAYARQRSVGLMTFDNEAELYKIKENFRRLNAFYELLLTIRELIFSLARNLEPAWRILKS